MSRAKLEGMRFGRLVVQCWCKESGKWVCLCDCGNIKKLITSHLKTSVKSCGCAKKEINKFSEFYKNNLYIRDMFHNMKNRCYNSNDPSYKNYGGRGITICDRWPENPTLLLEDLGHRPTTEHTIERIDVDKGYCPDNCTWATPTEQALNRRVFSNNTSGFKGVHKRSDTGKWRAYISVDNSVVHLGSYEHINSAIQARIDAELKYYGKRLQ